MLENFYTKRTFCRKVVQQDIPTISYWRNSKVAYGDFLTTQKIPLDDTIEKFKNDYFWNDNGKHYLIELKENALPIGTIKYWTNPLDIKCALITIKIALPEYRNQGYGTEVQKALIRELFRKYKFESVEMHTDINNNAQQACLKKLDFKNIQTENYEDGGVFRQGYLYRLTKERYEKSGVHIYYYE